MDAKRTSRLGEAACVAKVEEAVSMKRERQARADDDGNIVRFASSFFLVSWGSYKVAL